ncbi:MAG: HNH endonuclease [Hyphomicrobiales bacterium]|nr:HNH endonuclease [Hyphomicrobiales bacterium]MBV8663474.1 HNH endonuclease [Hyphomicrobiales bacterium]
MTVTAEILRERLHYDPSNVVFTWILPPKCGSVAAGDVAGSMSKGYRTIMLDGRNYAAHRLAWLYVTGEWPSGDVDHVNLDKADNRLSNLRVATDSQNLANRRKNSNNTSGLKGVTWNKLCRKWLAQIVVNRKHKYLGVFDCPAAAHFAYVIAADRHFGEFARAA